MEPIWIAAVAIAIITFLYAYLTWNFNYWKTQGVKHAKPLPVIGTLKPTWKKKLEEQDVHWYKKFGRIYGTYEGRHPVLHVAEPELLRTIFVKHFEVFPLRRDVKPPNKTNFARQFLMNMESSEWRYARHKMSPTFSARKIKPLLNSMDSYSKILYDQLQKYSDSKKAVDIRKYISYLNMDVLAAYALGIEANALKNPNNPLVANAGELFSKVPHFVTYLFFLFPTSMRYITSILQPKPLFYLKDVVDRVMDKRTKDKELKKESNDILHYLMRNETNLHLDAVNAQGITYLAAFDFLATVVSVACYELVMNPQYQERLIAEIDNVLITSNGVLQYEDIRNMQFLDMVVKETLRKHPPITRVERKCIVEGYRLNGITLKKGMMITIPIYAIHHDEEYYPNPEVFDPERFNLENVATRSPFTFLTFGMGPRNCIGVRLAMISIKLNLIHLFSQFRLTKCSETQIPLKLDTVGFGVSYLNSLFFRVNERTDKAQFE